MPRRDQAPKPRGRRPRVALILVKAAVDLDYRCCLRSLHDHVITVADKAAGIDEPAPAALRAITRLAAARPSRRPTPTERYQLVDRWDTRLADITVDQGVLADVRVRLPGAIVIVDRFQLIKKANEMVDAARCRDGDPNPWRSMRLSSRIGTLALARPTQNRGTPLGEQEEPLMR